MVTTPPATDKTYNADFLAILSHSRRLNAQLKYIQSSEQLAALKNTLDECFALRKENIAVEEAESFKKVAKIQSLKRMMEEQGISMHELLGDDIIEQQNNASTSAKRVKIQANQRVMTPDGRSVDPSHTPRYRFPTECGQTTTWHGKGHRPAQLRTLIENGRTLEEFKITQD